MLCWAHARRDFSDAVKAIKDPDLAKRSTAYQALVRIAAIYKLDESLKELTFAVEAGSAGEAQVTELGAEFTPVTTQANALMEVAAGSSDAAVIDSLMAAAMVGEGTGYANLTYTVQLNSEEYGVGFRKGSDLAAALNEFFVTAYTDGSMVATAETYGVQAAVIEQK